MAAFDTTRPTYGTHGPIGRFGTLIAGLFGSFSQWNDARQTRNALAKLTDRELDDIGLNRSDIEYVSTGQALH